MGLLAGRVEKNADERDSEGMQLMPLKMENWDWYLGGDPGAKADGMNGWRAGRWGCEGVVLSLSLLVFMDELSVFCLRSYLC